MWLSGTETFSRVTLPFPITFTSECTFRLPEICYRYGSFTMGWTSVSYVPHMCCRTFRIQQTAFVA